MVLPFRKCVTSVIQRLERFLKTKDCWVVILSVGTPIRERHELF